MRTRATVALFGAIALLVGCSSPTEQSATSTPSSPGPIRGPGPSVATPVVAGVLAAPIPVPATDGKVHLAYELQLTNVLPHDVTLTSVTVLDHDVALLNLTGEQLDERTRVLGTPTATTKVGSAQTAAVWLDVALDRGAEVPPPPN
jgi:hypothetical protein